MASEPAAPNRTKPVFVLNRVLPGAEEKAYTVSELCRAAEKTAGFDSVIGAQRIGGLWRLYPKTMDARMALLSKGLILRSHTIEVKDKNPFIVRDSAGTETEIPSTRVVIGNVPISVSNTDILNAIVQLGVKTRSSIRDELDRDENGKLTRWLTGRRFIFIDVPEGPLPKTVKIGAFTATIYHKEQKKLTCSNCLVVNSHHASICTAPTKCRVCLKDGHKSGDPECSLAPPTPPPPSSPPSTNITTEEEKSTAAETVSIAMAKLRHNSAEPNSRGRSRTPKRPPSARSPDTERDSKQRKHNSSNKDNTQLDTDTSREGKDQEVDRRTDT